MKHIAVREDTYPACRVTRRRCDPVPQGKDVLPGSSPLRHMVVVASIFLFLVSLLCARDLAAAPWLPVALPARPALIASGSVSFVPLLTAPAASGLADLVFGTFLGGSEDDNVSAVAVDGTGAIYVAGATQSADFATTPGAFKQRHGGDWDAFVVKLDKTGSRIVFSTFLGGSGYDMATGIAVDAGGNIYVTGQTQSPDFPTTLGAYDVSQARGDAFVVKLNPSGSTLLYATFLGGSGWATTSGIAVDGGGNAYVAGQTNSADFSQVPPTTSKPLAAGVTTAFVAKLNPAGSQLGFATRFGGNDSGVQAIALDAAGSVYVTGSAWSPDFPVAAGRVGNATASGGIFAAKIDSAGGHFAYVTIVGFAHAPMDAARAIAVHSDGSVYVAGETNSPSFPTTPGAYRSSLAPGTCQAQPCADAFILRLSAGGDHLVYSTLLGGGSRDVAAGLAVNKAGEAIVAGQTYSHNFPATSDALKAAFKEDTDPFACGESGICTEAFVAKLSADGRNLLYSTFLGGNESDAVSALAMDSSGNVYVTGLTLSRDFPATSGANDTSCGTDGACNFIYFAQGGYFPKSDGFVVKLAVGGQGQAAPAGDEEFGCGGFFKDGIWIQSPSGSRRRLETQGLQVDNWRWSPDGQKIVFESSTFLSTGELRSRLYLLDASSQQVTLLTDVGGTANNLAWSPDGSQVAFTLSVSGSSSASLGSGILLVDIMQGGLVRLLDVATSGFSLDYSSALAWAPDGRTILFAARAGTDPTIQIFALDVKGRTTSRLTSPPGYNQAPAWSPNGDRIAFESSRDAPTEHQHWLFDIYVMDKSGAQQTRLTSSVSYSPYSPSKPWSQPSLATSSVHPTWAPDGTAIAFSRIRVEMNASGQATGDSQVYTIGSREGVEHRLTDISATDFWHPQWSPGGQRIAAEYYYPRSIRTPTHQIMNADGTGMQPVACTSFYWRPRPRATPTPSPLPITTATRTVVPTPAGGQELIAFVSTRDNDDFQVYVVNPDGSNRRKLTNRPGGAGDPAISPDGTRIAFVAPRIGASPPDIYVMNLDGSGLINITANPAEDGWPSWYSDGRTIAFSSRRDGNLEIYVVNADGSGLSRLTNNPSDDACPTFSPDGRSIAFSSNRTGAWEIFVMAVDGTQVRQLTSLGDPNGQGWPSWSPDGKRIIFESDASGNREIFVMNADGTGVVNLTKNPAYDGAPVWSPDGRQIAFVSDRAGGMGIFVMRDDGNQAAQLTNTYDWGPSWSGAPVRPTPTLTARTPVPASPTTTRLAPTAAATATGAPALTTTAPTSTPTPNTGEQQAEAPWRAPLIGVMLLAIAAFVVTLGYRKR